MKQFEHWPLLNAEDVNERLLEALDEAEIKAIDSLGRYKFQMFGYWAAIWVHLNRISGAKRPSPFAEFVIAAKRKCHAGASASLSGDAQCGKGDKNG